jgi:LPXTG-motif cell wall-anchored protein
MVLRLMRSRGHRIASFLVAFSLALPAAAYGQSAGDDQYQDPFGGGGGGGGQEQEQPAQPQATPAPAEPAPAAPAEPEAAAPAAEPTAAAAAPSSQEQLPNTGLETGLVAAAGALLIGAGVTLRARSGTR